MAGISAYLVRKNKEVALMEKSLKLSLATAFVSSILVVFPFGHVHTQQVAETQPEKFAAMEGLKTTQSQAPLVLFGLVSTQPPELKAKVEIPGLLSWMAFGDVNATVQGLDEFAEDEVPPIWLTFVSFHNMVILGMFLIGVSFWGMVQIFRKRLVQSRRYLRLLIWSIPLPIAAIQFGWIVAEVGRQPWIVYRVMRTSDAFSPTVPAGQVWFSLIMFCLIYILLFCLYLFLLIKKVKQGPEPVHA